MEEIAKRFIASYYRLAFRDPSQSYKFYLPGAHLSRFTNKQNYQSIFSPTSFSLPFNPSIHIVKVLAYSSFSAIDYIVIDVFGVYYLNSRVNNSDNHEKDIEKKFSQQFVLMYSGRKWGIKSDTFAEFESLSTRLVNADEQNEPPPQYYNAGQYHPQAPSVQTGSSKRPKVNDFDPQKTISIELPNNYNGDEVMKLFNKFGPVSKQLYTHNLIYVEFQNSEDVDKITALPHGPIYNGSYTRVSRGILSKTPSRH